MEPDPSRESGGWFREEQRFWSTLENWQTTPSWVIPTPYADGFLFKETGLWAADVREGRAPTRPEVIEIVVRRPAATTPPQGTVVERAVEVLSRSVAFTARDIFYGLGDQAIQQHAELAMRQLIRSIQHTACVSPSGTGTN
jgi:hypothetical protein